MSTWSGALAHLENDQLITLSLKVQIQALTALGENGKKYASMVSSANTGGTTII
jgi:hypothetical protein